jgi:energy-coupling factor transporter ATP-binding protein EcfA2
MLTATTHELVINIGGMPILVRTESPEFARLLEDRYGRFVTTDGRHAFFQLEVELVKEPGFGQDDEDLSVRLDLPRWVMERGDFHAEWDPELRQGWVRQTANRYSIDAVLRILHSLILAREGGFLVHAASAIRNGRAFLFAGPSGAGKTTLARLAPPDVALLTDEISYVRKVRIQDSGLRSQKSEVRSPYSASRAPSPQPPAPAFEAFGTPFAGELARIGENLRAPVAALYLLTQGLQNRVEPVGEADAARALLQNILFFAQDSELVRLVFQSAVDFVSRVPVQRLVFTPDARVWELIA